MKDHVLDDESCWCGVPLAVHDDVYDEAVGHHDHRPDPVPPYLGTAGQPGACCAEPTSLSQHSRPGADDRTLLSR